MRSRPTYKPRDTDGERRALPPIRPMLTEGDRT